MLLQALPQTALHNHSLPMRGKVTHGWGWIHYDGKPVGILGRGDFLDPLLFERPLGFAPIGSTLLVNGSGTGIDVALLHRSLSSKLARQAARLSTHALVRTADLFVELIDKIAPRCIGTVELDLPVSQSELGALLGMSTVHMNRTLMILKRMGLLTTAKGVFFILDREGMLEQAMSSP